MSISCVAHWPVTPARVLSSSWMFHCECLYCHLSTKLLAGSRTRALTSLKVKRQTSTLVFIFLFYISLNVQRVRCSLVKYLCIHVSQPRLILNFFFFGGGSTSELFFNHWMPFLWTRLIAICLFSFNNVLRILFAKTKWAVVACTFVHIFIFK